MVCIWGFPHIGVDVASKLGTKLWGAKPREMPESSDGGGWGLGKRRLSSLRLMRWHLLTTNKCWRPTDQAQQEFANHLTQPPWFMGKENKEKEVKILHGTQLSSLPRVCLWRSCKATQLRVLWPFVPWWEFFPTKDGVWLNERMESCGGEGKRAGPGRSYRYTRALVGKLWWITQRRSFGYSENFRKAVVTWSVCAKDH